MFIINEDKSIYITRGDVAFFSIEAKTDTGEKYRFMPGDVVRFKVCGKKDCENVVLSKDFGIETESEEVSIYLEEKDTKFGDVISKPTVYWYEVELNPYTDPQTILGYDEDGPKTFTLYPEGNEIEDNAPVTPEEIPVVDEELDLTSTRPVQNQAISRAIAKINEIVRGELLVHSEAMDEKNEEHSAAMSEEVKKVEEEVARINEVFPHDVHDDFFVEKSSKLYSAAARGYKQGNLVSVVLIAAAKEDIAAEEVLFKINPAYAPMVAIPVFPVIYMKSGAASASETYKSGLAAVGDGEIASLDAIDKNDGLIMQVTYFT